MRSKWYGTLAGDGIDDPVEYYWCMTCNKEQLNKVKVSDIEGDANVAGVFVNWSHDEDHNVDEINMERKQYQLGQKLNILEKYLALSLSGRISSIAGGHRSLSGVVRG